LYWSRFYGDRYCIDGDFNAKEHARYVRSLLDLVGYTVQSIGDYGFGKGKLLYEFYKAFRPVRIVAVEPHEERVKDLRKKKWIQNSHIQIYQSNLEDFNPKYLSYTPLDLGICNSVLQYVEDRKLETILERLARFNKLLYVAVPTQNDYIRMKKELGFNDPYARARPLKVYRRLFSKYFWFVGLNLLESRYNIEPTRFEAELYKF